MAAAPWLPELLRARGPRRLAFALATVVAGLSAAARRVCRARWARASRTSRGADDRRPASRRWRSLALCCGAMLAVFRFRDAWLAWLGVLASVLLVTGLRDLSAHRRRPARAAASCAASRQHAAGIAELGFVDLREQFALQLQAADRLLRSRPLARSRARGSATPRDGSRRTRPSAGRRSTRLASRALRDLRAEPTR